MATTSTTEHVSMILNSDAPSASSPIKVYMHVVGTTRADVRAIRTGTALAKAGFDVSILDVESADVQLAAENREGLRIQHLLVPKTFVATRFKRWTLFRAIALCIRSAIRLTSTAADIYHALDLPALPACYIAAAVRRKPLVFESYELPLSTLPLAEMSVSRRLLQALIAFLLSHMVSHCAAVIVVSPSIEREICKRYSCSTVSLVRNIAPYRRVPGSGKLREQLKLAPHMRVALYQGYLQPDRGLDLLVKAAPFLEKSVVLVLMGEDRLRTQGRLETLIISEGVADRVKIIPAVPYAELLEWTASADIGWNASQYRLFYLDVRERINIMKQCTTQNHLTRTIQRLEHILADEGYPAVRAAELLVATLLELAQKVPELEQQIKDIVCLYEQCAARQYGPFYYINQRKKVHETL